MKPWLIRSLRSVGGWVLVLVLAVGSTACRHGVPANSLATHDSSSWRKDLAAFAEGDRTTPPPPHPIVFVGSSSIRLWRTLGSDFAGVPVINRGFGGSQLADVVNHVGSLVLRYEPRQVVIYAGGNDLNAGKPSGVVYGDFVALAHRIRDALPHTRIAYISIAPNPARWAQVAKVRQANALIAGYCRRHGLDFIDVFPLMLGEDGLPKPDLFVADRLHMNASGYALWTEAVRPYLDRNSIR